MGGGAWWAAVPGVSKSRTRLSEFTFTFYFHALEKEMATHSSILAWRIPGAGEPGGLPSMGSHRVGHNWRDLAVAAAAFLLKLKCIWKKRTFVINAQKHPGAFFSFGNANDEVKWLQMTEKRTTILPSIKSKHCSSNHNECAEIKAIEKV